MPAADGRRSRALIDQLRAISNWLSQCPPDAFDRPTVLPEWDVQTLTGHLLMMVHGALRGLQSPTRTRPQPIHDYVASYRSRATVIAEATARTTADRTPEELLTELSTAIDGLAAALAAPVPATVEGPGGPIAINDFLATRIIEAVVHADDLSRSLVEVEPIVLNRAALAVTSRALTGILAAHHPGQTIEVRVPPFAAVQCGTDEPGPRHTRGTPPNVVETDPLTFLRLATGRIDWAAARTSGTVSASGHRADLSLMVPVLS